MKASKRRTRAAEYLYGADLLRVEFITRAGVVRLRAALVAEGLHHAAMACRMRHGAAVMVRLKA